MIKKSNPRNIKWNIVVSLVICFAAVFIGLMAVNLKQYIIAVVMFLIAIWQIWNCKQWKKTE